METLLFMGFLVLLLIGVTVGSINFFRNDAARIRGFSKAIPYFLGSAVMFILYLSFTTVNSGTIGVVRRFGNPVRQLSPGAHLLLPFAEWQYPIDTQTRIVKPDEQASSKDLQVVHTQVTFAYHIEPAFATYMLVTLNNDADNLVIKPAILEAIKATTAKYDAQELITNRPAVRDGIEDFVKQRLAPYHIIAETTSITDFSFTKTYEDAIEAKVTAQQNAEKAKNDLVRIQVQAQQQIAQAKGEAEALRAQKEQITPELLQLRTIEMMKEKWDGQLPNVIVSSGQGALPMMDVLEAGKKLAGNKR